MQSFENLEIKSVETILITPEIARVMMSKNNGNRRVAPTTVNYYSQMMKKGKRKYCKIELAMPLEKTTFWERVMNPEKTMSSERAICFEKTKDEKRAKKKGEAYDKKSKTDGFNPCPGITG